MGGWFSGGNSSTESQATDNSTNVTGQGVALVTRIASGGTGGSRVRLAIGRGATYAPVFNSGLNEDQVADLISSAVHGMDGMGSPRSDQTVEEAAEAAIAERIEEQIVEGPDKANALPAYTWPLVIVGTVLLFIVGGIKFFMRRKKT